MKKDNIFDLAETDDLPKKMVARISVASLARGDLRILSLFDIKKALTATEVMVGLYRKFQLERSIQSIHTALHHLKKDGLLKKMRRGIYEKA